MNKNKMEPYDIVFIGAGPATLFCASKLLNKKNFIILEKGKTLNQRIKSLHKNTPAVKSDILFGEGGVGLFLDGKLNFSTEIGGNILDVMNPWVISQIKRWFIKKYEIKPHYQRIKKIKIPNGKCLTFPQYHFGTENLPKLIKTISQGFRRRIICNTEVTSINKSKNIFSVTDSKRKIYLSRALIVATGQSNFDFVTKIAQYFKLKTESNEVSIGIRLEASNANLKKYFTIQYDPKLIFTVKQGEVRTFCSNPGGYVISEKKEGFTTANGHAQKNKKSNFSNLAILLKSREKNKLISMCKTISQKTKDRLIVQNTKDFLQNITTSKLIFPPQHTNCTIAQNIYSYLPTNIIAGLQEAIKSLLIIEPGLINSIFYFPEIKIFPSKIKVNKNTIESKVPNLYFIGDCCGYIHGLWNAILSGTSCGNNFLKKR